MKNSALVVGRLACCAMFTLAALGQNSDVPPDQPFQAVHLFNLKSPDAEKTLLAALTDINQAIAKAGCPKCGYHLWKVSGTQAGNYSHLWSSSWPGRDVYVKVHNSAGYQAAINRHPDLNPIMESQIYNRYVEVTAGQ